MKRSAWLHLVICVAAVSIGSRDSHAQQQQPPPQRPQPAATDSNGSFAELTAELRLLRLAVERSTQVQTQIQALSVYLSAQQSRLVHSSSRADALRRDLDGATREVGHFADRVAELERSLALPQMADHKGQFEGELQEMKRMLARATATEAQLRAREADAASAVQNDLSVWNDLISRLQQMTAR